jgi:serpin B
MLTNKAAVALCDEEAACGPAVAFELLEPRVLLSADQAGLGAAGVAAPVGSPVAPAMTADMTELVKGNNAFAFDLYKALRTTDGSLFYSPFSISAALSMTYAGAAGNTAQQMAEVLHFTLPRLLHDVAFGSLIQRLTAARSPSRPGLLGLEDENPGDPFTLKIANSLWGQPGFEFLDNFLNTLASEYDSPLRLTDFMADPEAARVRINQWVSDQTMGHIPDLIHPGDIAAATALVLVNAMYFKGSWVNAFSSGPAHAFHLPGDSVNVQMITQTHDFSYAEGPGYQAIDLPYVGGASMTILLPDAGQFDNFEKSLSATKVETILGGLQSCDVHVTMPQFECRTHLSLKGTLPGMGMSDAFDAYKANFSQMSPGGMVVGDVIHEAWIKVDEKGTEAAAATAVIMSLAALGQGQPPPPKEFMADRPFIYMIRDKDTGSILFVGRVSDASVLKTADGPADPVTPVEPAHVAPTPLAPTPRHAPCGPYLPVSATIARRVQADAPLRPTEAGGAENGRARLVDALRSAPTKLGLVLSAPGLGQAGAALPSLRLAPGTPTGPLDAPTLRPDWMASPLKDLGPGTLSPSLAAPL